MPAVHIVGPTARDDEIGATARVEVVSAALAAQYVVARMTPVGVVLRGSREDVGVACAAGGLGLPQKEL